MLGDPSGGVSGHGASGTDGVAVGDPREWGGPQGSG